MDIDSFLSSMLQNASYDLSGDPPSLPPTKEPVWFLGRKYNLPSDQSELEDDIRTKLWFTYRKNFNPIGGNGPTSDQGWGCMLRCGQMVLAQALVCCHLGRNWRWRPESTEPQDGNYQKFNKILRLFLDERDHTYSVQQIASMGESEGKAIGEWFGPNAIAQVLRKLSTYDKWGNVTIYICMDHSIIKSEITSHCKSSKDVNLNQHMTDKSENSIEAAGQSEKDSSAWRPVLLVVPIMLGLSSINPTYYDQLKACFRFEQSVGVLGGKPSHAYWFVGYTEDNLLYFDPHVTQPRVDPHSNAKLHDTFHIKCPNHTNIKDLDPSMALGFFCKTEADFRLLCQNLEADIMLKSTNPILEVYPTRPRFLVPPTMPQRRTICTDVGEDEEDEFELI